MLEEKKPNKIWLNILLAAFYLFALAILLNNSFGYLDPDFGWHLKMGEQIWQTRAVPTINHEDYTLLGTHWVDHEWLSDLAVYLVCHFLGYVVLSICFALLIILTLIIQLQFTRKYFLNSDRGILFVLLLQALGAYAALPHLGVRVQEITVLCLLLLLIIIYRYNKNKDYRWLIWLIPLFIFWASAHGGFLLGLGVLALFVLVKAVELWSAKKLPTSFLNYDKILKAKQIGVFAGFSFLALATTFATPYGYQLQLFLLGCRDSFYQTYLSEWLGEYAFPLVYPQLVYLEIVLLFGVLLFIAAFKLKGEHRRRIDLWEAALIIVFIVLAFQARRNFPLLFIVSLPISSYFFINFFLPGPLTVERLKFLSEKMTRRIKPLFRFNFLRNKSAASAKNKKISLKNIWVIIFSLALLVAGGIVVSKTKFTNQPEQTYQAEYPYQAVNFLKAHPEWNDLKIFNDYGWGGYLIWQDPSRELFVDGRLPEYPLRGSTVLKEYSYFFDPKKMAAQLQYYDIGLVLIGSQEKYPQINPLEQWYFYLNQNKINTDAKKSFALLDYLRTSPQWKSVYRDSLAEIFIKQAK